MNRSHDQRPRHVQIREEIHRALREGRWAPHERMPSEADLAAKFGVSRITAKHALNALSQLGLLYRIAGKGTFASPEGAAAAAAGSHVKPSTGAAPLLGLIFPYAGGNFNTQMLFGVEAEAANHGYHMVLRRSQNDRILESEIIGQMIELGVRGLVIWPADGQYFSEKILRLTLDGFPLVLIDRRLRGVATNCVLTDNLTGACEAVQHLIDHGHRSIGVVSIPVQDTFTLEDRLEGYQRALSANSIPIDRNLWLIDTPVEESEGRWSMFSSAQVDVIRTFLQSHPQLTAVFTLNGGMGLATLQAAGDLGLRVPADLSIVSYDGGDLTDPAPWPLTYVDQNPEAMGAAAVRLLCERIAGNGGLREVVVLPSRLIPLGSTGPARALSNQLPETVQRQP